MSQLLALPIARLTDSNGVIIPNGRLYSYLTGTTTAAATYTTDALDVSHGAYVQANSAGLLPPIYIDPTVSYRFKVKTALGAADVPGMDFDPVTAATASTMTFTPEGTGAVIRTVQDKLGEIISVKDFGAVGDGTTDDTAAFQAAIDVGTSYANAYTSIYIPPGDYRITDTIRINKNRVRLYGAGVKSCLYFDPPSSGKVMLILQHSDTSQVIGIIELDHFGVRASYPDSSTYTKTGIKVIDGTGVSIHHVTFPDESWVGGSGSGSIALHMCGRDNHRVYDNYFKADAPIYVGLNPNDSTYQFDCHSFNDLWLETLKSTNYAITFAAGVNPANWNLGPNCNALRGKGGIFLDNSGLTTATASMIFIKQFRVESGTISGGASGGYGIYMDFGVTACGNLEIDMSSVNDPTCNGYWLKGVTSLTAKNINVATTGNAFILTDVNQAEIFSLGLSNSATVTFNSMYAEKLHKLSGAAATDKSIGYGYFKYYASDTPANTLVYENGVRIWSKTATLANAGTMNLPALTSGQSMLVTVSTNSGGALYHVNYTTVTKLSGSAGYGVTGGGEDIILATNGSGATGFTNSAAGSQVFYVSTRGA